MKSVPELHYPNLAPVIFERAKNMVSKFRMHLRLPAVLIMALASASASVSVNATATSAEEIDTSESADIRDASSSNDHFLILTAEAALHDLATANADSLVAQADAQGMALETGASMVADASPQGVLRDWSAVESHQLDDMRGGFDTSLHLTLSFGIERAVYLNGALVTTTSFNLPSMTGSRPDDPAIAAMPSSAVALVQNGAGNTFASSPSNSPMAATVIQNTLNNQTLQGVTTINAAANSLQLLRANAFQAMMLESLNQGVIPH
jgi:hypothetical protein